MAPTIEGQAEINGLLTGPATSYDLVKFNPWRRHTRASQSDPRAWRHGSWSGAEWRDELVVDIELHYGGGTTAEWQDLHFAASAAFAAVGDIPLDREIRFIRGGVEKVIFGRPRTFDPEIRRGANRSFVMATFVAQDPFIYSAELYTTGAVSLPSYVSGITAPLRAPLVVHGVRVGGEAELINQGTAPSGLRLRIDGPVNTPRITVRHPDGTVNSLLFDLNLGAGRFLIVDTATHQVTIDGLETSRRGQTTPLPGWPLVQPGGVNELRFTAPRFDTGTVTAEWRDKWW